MRLMVDYESSIETSSLSTKGVQSIISVNFRMEKMATTVNQEKQIYSVLLRDQNKVVILP